MKSLPLRSAMIGLLLMLPLATLELLRSPSQPRRDFFVLFGVLWLLPTVLAYVATPVLQALVGGKRGMKPLPMLAKATVVLLVFGLWTGLVVDQFPCFLGVPNCD